MLFMFAIALVVLLILSGFFSGTETALMSVNMVKVNALLKQKRKGSEALHRLKQNPRKLIITILICNNLVNIGAAALATVVFTDIFGSSGAGIATGIMTFLVLVFGEISPKTLASENAEKMSLAVARPIEIISKVLSPFVVFFALIAKAASRLAGSKEEKAVSEAELKSIVTMGRDEGILTREAAEIIHNVLEFQDTRVVEIMTPVANMEMVDGEKKLRDVLNFVVKSPFSRYPIYSKNKNKIIGVLDVDDVLRYVKNRKLGVRVKHLKRKVYFVPEAKEVDDLLSEFEGEHMPLAVVVNEYGDVSGLITIEDILEEIVGDIFDKSKRESMHIKKINKKLLRVDARATIEELNKVLRLGLEAENFDTIAGFVEHYFKKIPKKGDKIKLRTVVIEVDRTTPQGIKNLIIRKRLRK